MSSCRHLRVVILVFDLLKISLPYMFVNTIETQQEYFVV